MRTRLSAITAIIRKDLELFWPLALTIFVLQLGLTLFLHEVTEFPGARLPTDRAFMNGANPIFWVGAGVPPILSAIFIVLAVQTDAATDRRHDWLTRPVNTFEIAAAKIALVLGVVFLPFALGTAIFTLAMQADPQLTMLPVFIMLRNCLFGVLLAWLVSSLLQAIIALVGLITTTAFLMAFVFAIATAVQVAVNMHTGLQVGGVSSAGTAITAWPRILTQTAITIAAIWPVLWLLLERRKVMMARLMFVAGYVVISAFPQTGVPRSAPDVSLSPPAIHLAPSGETQHA